MAVRSCASDKALGPDGFNFEFIKRYWDLLKDDLLKFVAEFLGRAFSLQGVTHLLSPLSPKLLVPWEFPTSDQLV